MTDKLTPRKRQALETRRHIQASALNLFDRLGFENVSMQDIARDAGCSIGNIYHYFKSKDELAIRATSQVDDDCLAWAEAHQDDLRRPLDKLIAFVADALVICSQQDILYTAYIHSMKYPEQGILAFREDRTWFRILRELIDDCREDGSIPPDCSTLDLTRQLVALHRGLLLQWRVENEGFDLAQTGELMARQLLAGIPR